MRKATIALLLLLVPAVALADLVIKEKVSSAGAMGMWKAGGVETAYLKGDRIRTESEMKAEGMMQGMMPEGGLGGISIVRLDKGVIWSLDADDSTYTETAFEDIAAVGDSAGGLEVADIRLTRTGEKKKIAGYECEGVLLESDFEVDAQGRPMTMSGRALFWVAEKKGELKELSAFWESMMGRMGAPDTGGFGAGMKALWEKLEDLDGVPLGMEMTLDSAEAGDEEQAEEMKNAMKMMKQYMKGMGKEVEGEEEEGGGHFMEIRREVISVEKTSLDDALFEIPKGFTKVKAGWKGPHGMPKK